MAAPAQILDHGQITVFTAASLINHNFMLMIFFMGMDESMRLDSIDI
jgi:hypothetical protein